MTYVCERCDKKFYDKSHLDNHLNRKIPCLVNNNKTDPTNNNYCEECDKYFSRPYTLKRHMNTYHNDTPNIGAKNNKGNQIITTGNNNNITINNNIKQYNLIAFGKDGIDCLSIRDKIAILSPDVDPFTMIIIKVNLDPKKLNHHNVGYTDNHSGFGIIYDGNKWLCRGIDTIIDTLLESKEKDILKICDEIKHFFSNEEEINETILDLHKIMCPTNQLDLRARKKLFAHIKNHLFNNKHLALGAKKYTEKYTNNCSNNSDRDKNFKNLKEGYTLEILDKIYLKRDMAKFFLRDLNIDLYTSKSLVDLIDKTDELSTLEIIIQSLVEAYYFNKLIDNDVIKKNINKKNIANKFVFG